MMACSNDMIDSLIDILLSNKLEDKTLIDKIFSTLEKLPKFSINTKQIRDICQLFNQDTPFKEQLLRILIKAAENDDPNIQTVSSYFDLQRPKSVRFYERKIESGSFSTTLFIQQQEESFNDRSL
jgi:hypothetical protein